VDVTIAWNSALDPKADTKGACLLGKLTLKSGISNNQIPEGLRDVAILYNKFRSMVEQLPLMEDAKYSDHPASRSVQS
jgi:hypothetical protein